jgi:3-hydroxy-3-methylglutaryl CoA synthase
LNRDRVAHVSLASTRLPYAERENAGVVKAALNLNDVTGVMDVCSSLRAGTSALIQALYASKGAGRDHLMLASEKRHSKPASESEMADGDAAAAFLVGSDDVVAKLVHAESISTDFVGQFRAADDDFDYSWEGRWVRDEGYGKLIPRVVQAVLARTSLTPKDIQHLVVGVPSPAAEKFVAERLGMAPTSLGKGHKGSVGFAGAADPLLSLVEALAVAKPGERILVIGFGQGCDALLFETTEALAGRQPCGGIEEMSARRKADENYVRYLAFSGHLGLHKGMRAEMDQKPVLTALYRNRKAVLGLVGIRDTKTGTVQFPPTEIAVDQTHPGASVFEDYPLAERVARVVTFTADHLTYSPDPPAFYGMIEFTGGGRMVADFTDLEAADIEVGRSMRMVFRIKATDELRGFTKYFWKATPVQLAK